LALCCCGLAGLPAWLAGLLAGHRRVGWAELRWSGVGWAGLVVYSGLEAGLAGWLAGCLAGWLTGWLAGWAGPYFNNIEILKY